MFNDTTRLEKKRPFNKGKMEAKGIIRLALDGKNRLSPTTGAGSKVRR